MLFPSKKQHNLYIQSLCSRAKGEFTMQIKSLQPRQGKIEIVAKVVEKGDTRTISTANFSGSVANAKLQDETGTIKCTLWNDQVAQVNVGDTVKISNGYVSEYQGEMQLSTGKFGKLEVVTPVEASMSTPKHDTATPKAPAKETTYDDYADDDSTGTDEEFVE